MTSTPIIFIGEYPPGLDLCAPYLLEFTLQKIQLCVKTLEMDISSVTLPEFFTYK